MDRSGVLVISCEGKKHNEIPCEVDDSMGIGASLVVAQSSPAKLLVSVSDEALGILCTDDLANFFLLNAAAEYE